MGQVLSSSSKLQAADDLAKEYVPASNMSDSSFMEFWQFSIGTWLEKFIQVYAFLDQSRT